MKSLFFISLLLMVTFAKAEECSEKINMSGAIQVNRQPLGELCIVNIHPVYVNDLFYRSFMFASDGMIMVFNSYGDVPPSTTTGAREFYLLPREGVTPDYKILEDGYVEILLPSGRTAIFSPNTGEMVRLTGATIKTKELSQNNDGGFEILTYDQPRIDFGFRMGESPMNTSYRKAEIIDSKGNRCRVKNTDLVSYNDPDNARLLHETDEKLLLEAKELCSNLQF